MDRDDPDSSFSAAFDGLENDPRLLTLGDATQGREIVPLDLPHDPIYGWEQSGECVQDTPFEVVF